VRRCGVDVLLAIVVGVVSALLTLATRWLVTHVAALVTGNGGLGGVIPRASAPYGELPVVLCLIVPAVGGLLGGLLISKVAPETTSEGVRVTRAALRADGSIRSRVVAIRPIATVLCVGSGGSAGTLGPMAHAGGAVGSGLARVIGLSVDRARLLVAAGSAGAVAALLGAPVAGACFALEVLLVSAAPRAVVTVVFAAGASGLVRWTLIGTAPLFELHPGSLPAGPYLLVPVLGLLCAVVGIAFVRLRDFTEVVCRTHWHGPAWLLPAIGGLLLGPLLVAAPQLWGVGLPVVQSADRGGYALGMLALLMVGKLVANCLSVGTGASGGMFTPLLFTGAMLGCAFGTLAVDLGMADHVAVFGLVAMAALAAGAARAPLSATVLVLETTRALSVALPVVLAVAVCFVASRLLATRFLYDADGPGPSPVTNPRLTA
jgi:CIC family chloride channel protein